MAPYSLKRQYLCTCEFGVCSKNKKNAVIENDVLMEDVVCNSPSAAGWIIVGGSNNGWTEWKDKNGKPINIFRNK